MILNSNKKDYSGLRLVVQVQNRLSQNNWQKRLWHQFFVIDYLEKNWTIKSDYNCIPRHAEKRKNWLSLILYIRSYNKSVSTLAKLNKLIKELLKYPPYSPNLVARLKTYKKSFMKSVFHRMEMYFSRGTVFCWASRESLCTEMV